MMLVPEDNVSERSTGTLLRKPFSLLPAGGPLLTLCNGVKVYFNKYIAGETGKLTCLTIPRVKFPKQSPLPTDIKTHTT